MDRLALHDPRTYAQGFPYDYFRELRDTEPVAHHEMRGSERGYWVITRHDDVQRVSRDPDTFKNAPNPFPDTLPEAPTEPEMDLLINLDAPDHVKMRKLVNRGFTPRRVAALEERLRARTDAILDSLRDRDGCDLVHDLALWLPLHVIADMVGVPEDDRAQVFAWTETTFGFDPDVTMDDRQTALQEMFAYADGLCRERQERPQDDLLSVLLEAEIEGHRLTQFQIDTFFMLLQNAGSETTRNLITTGTLRLIERPDAWETLRAEPELIPTAVEELLRHVTPVMHFNRRAVADCEVGGTKIQAGDRVLLSYTSANRDERAFDDPDEIDITRQPNDHTAFGAGGPHFCLGASLARLESRVMFEQIISRFEGLEVDGDPAAMPRVHSNLIDGFAHLPVRWKRVA